jgi:hypothetical protein
MVKESYAFILGEIPHAEPQREEAGRTGTW